MNPTRDFPILPRGQFAAHNAPHKPNHVAAALCLLLLVAATFLFTGCKSALDTNAKILTTTVSSVDVAMKGYAAAVALGAVSTNDQARVRALYAHYQAAEAIAESAIIAAIKTGDAGSLAQTSAALTAAREPLLAYLARFNRPPLATPPTQ